MFISRKRYTNQKKSLFYEKLSKSSGFWKVFIIIQPLSKNDKKRTRTNKLQS